MKIMLNVMKWQMTWHMSHYLEFNFSTIFGISSATQTKKKTLKWMNQWGASQDYLWEGNHKILRMSAIFEVAYETCSTSSL